MTNFEIEAFLNVVKYGSISTAAPKLFITQPALSRRIYALEKELGFSLFKRGKGIRNTELTEKGTEFIGIAKKWNELVIEAQTLAANPVQNLFKICCVDSWSSYLFPPVYKEFIEKYPEVSLSVYMQHSFEAYESIKNKTIDIAFVTDDIYSKDVQTVPAFKEEMCLITSNSKYKGMEYIETSQLDTKKEIRLPWNPEFDSWHEYWFGFSGKHLVVVDKMSLLEEFISIKDSWAIVPKSASKQLCQRLKLEEYKLFDPPPERICYYLIGETVQKPEINNLLKILNKTISDKEGICSLL